MEKLRRCYDQSDTLEPRATNVSRQGKIERGRRLSRTRSNLFCRARGQREACQEG